MKAAIDAVRFLRIIQDLRYHTERQRMLLPCRVKLAKPIQDAPQGGLDAVLPRPPVINATLPLIRNPRAQTLPKLPRSSVEASLHTTKVVSARPLRAYRSLTDAHDGDRPR
jgi:hypothetical protein